MASKLLAPAAETGITTGKFVRFRKSDRAVWSTANVPGFETYNASNIANYGIAATEIGATGVYEATDPAETTEGDWFFIKAAGASLAVSDLVSNIYYTGSANVANFYARQRPVQVYVAPHGDDTRHDGLSPAEPKLTIAAALTVARAYYGSELNIFGGEYNLGTTPNNCFTYETYTQFAALTETGNGANTRFTIEGDGTEGYNTPGDDDYLVGSQMTPTTGAAAGTLYRISELEYVGPDWEITVSPNFGGGSNYTNNISGKTLTITRERVKTGVSVRCLGPVDLIYEGLLTTSNQGPCWIPGEGSSILGHPKLGIKIKLTGTGFQAAVGQYTANNATLNGTTFGTGNYVIGNMGNRNDAGDESDSWYDNYADGNRTGIVGMFNYHGRANWDSGRAFEAATRKVYGVDCSFTSIGPTALGGSGQNESRAFAMTGGTAVFANSDFDARDGTDGAYAVWMSGSASFTALPGCRFSYAGTGKKVKLAGGTFINATGQTIAAGDRDTASGTYSEVDVETREEAIEARIASSPADIRMILTRTPPAVNVAGVLPVDLTHLIGDSDAAAGLTTAGGNYADFGEFNAKLVDAHAGVIATFQAGLATAANLAVVDGLVDNIFTAFELNSGNYRLTSAAVANVEGGGSTLTITPLVASVANPFYATRDLPKLPAASGNTIVWTITDGAGAAVSLSGKTIRLVAYLTSDSGDDVDSVIDDTIAASFQYATSGDGITVGGADNNQITLVHSITKTATPGNYRYFLLNVTDRIVLAKGRMPIEPSVWGS